MSESTGIAGLLPDLLAGLRVSLQVTVLALLLAAACALLAGLARFAGNRPLRWLAGGYVELFRGTSVLVQLFWAYFALPFLGLQLSAFAAAVLVLGLNTGAYGAEVLRGALSAVPRSQWEAAQALGYRRSQALWRVILPQVWLPVCPPAGNLAIELLKNTALVSLITLADLSFSAQLLRAETLRTFEIYALVLLLYFLAARLIALAMRDLEGWLARGRRRPAPP